MKNLSEAGATPIPMALNTGVFMTRSIPHLPRKVLLRDSRIAMRMIQAWDLYNSGTRVLEIFLKEQDKLSDERYWELLRTVWVVAGSVEHAPVFRGLFTSKRPRRHLFSTPEDAAVLRSLPARIEVHRATDDPLDGGLSWSLSRAFVHEYRQIFAKAIIISRWVDKSEVFAYIGRARESEVILL